MICPICNIEMYSNLNYFECKSSTQLCHCRVSFNSYMFIRFYIDDKKYECEYFPNLQVVDLWFYPDKNKSYLLEDLNLGTINDPHHLLLVVKKYLKLQVFG